MPIDELLDAPAWQCADAVLLAEIEELERVRRRVDAALIVRIGEMDKRGLAVAEGASATAPWLHGRLRINPGRAKALTETAKRVAETYALSAAELAAGAVSLEHVQAIVRCLDPVEAHVPPAELAGG